MRWRLGVSLEPQHALGESEPLAAKGAAAAVSSFSSASAAVSSSCRDEWPGEMSGGGSGTLSVRASKSADVVGSSPSERVRELRRWFCAYEAAAARNSSALDAAELALFFEKRRLKELERIPASIVFVRSKLGPRESRPGERAPSGRLSRESLPDTRLDKRLNESERPRSPSSPLAARARASFFERSEVASPEPGAAAALRPRARASADSFARGVPSGPSAISEAVIARESQSCASSLESLGVFFLLSS
mmetsp:Transcript_36308/g.84824  ORF Transcript_36308/g.84824 Transcript_36308/m.84824 type:complete len:249 (-) Transcript_36308:1372-2118(-)